MSKMSRRIVVDASVAMSAGKGIHPISAMSRDFLLEMMTICHKAVVSKEIMVEWKKHASLFSVSWLAAMRRRRKVVTVNPETGEEHLQVLRRIAGFTSQQIDAMEKDLLLILAALETDELIASCDSTARNLFARASREVTVIQNIVWVNPIDENHSPLDWLKSGARNSPDRRLRESTESEGDTNA
jgi:hypothetical protein